MRVLYTNPEPNAELDAIGGRRVSLDELLRESDFVTLHVPLDDSTRHLMGARELALMKPTACLVNTARGPIVDEAALVVALRDGQIAGAGLDVYENEPAPAPGLTALDNVVCLPHLGSATLATRSRMAHQAFLTNEALQNIARATFDNLNEFFETGTSRNEICYQCDTKPGCRKDHTAPCF